MGIYFRKKNWTWEFIFEEKGLFKISENKNLSKNYQLYGRKSVNFHVYFNSLGFTQDLCYGFDSFCVYFLNKYPDRFVSPLRVSGSSASIRDQLLASCQLCHLMTQLIKQTISAHQSGSRYRDLSLDTCESDITLERKKICKKRLD